MPKRIIDPIVKHVSKDKALKKAITYRIIVAVGGILILSGSWLLTNNALATVLGGSIASEGFRTGAYYIHEKWWEKNERRI
jgi:uncharacterized membrane protein